MYKLEMRVEIGEKHELIMDKHKFNSLVPLLDTGTYVLSLIKERKPKTIDEYRAEYFAKRDIVADETGNSKKDIHQWAKDKFLGGRSTTTLSIEDWQCFITNFRTECFEHFNIFL